jgi:hypothetical protein
MGTLPMTEHASSIADRFEWLLRVARERASRHELAVAVALAAHVNSRTGTAWPSARAIAGSAGLDLRHAWPRSAGCATPALCMSPSRAGQGGARPTRWPERRTWMQRSAHRDATERRTWMRRSVAPGCDAALHRDATERCTWVRQNTE